MCSRERYSKPGSECNFPGMRRTPGRSSPVLDGALVTADVILREAAVDLERRRNW